MSVLPPVIHEGEYNLFKFWFNNSVQDGVYYHNELFYRLQTVALNHRAQLYHQACKLAQHDTVIVTTSMDTCSVWISLRSPSAIRLSQN
ncbi:MAG: hypothetical protein HC769_19695 [Cyanobacteria bacterium CRU_2_1]|nr:hypothetical protein [Cyanobacteria bacterium RU_5_0]NJR60848.1 hypothetical protein [Cyanobacteria bacterium CRU_2_1]